MLKDHLGSASVVTNASGTTEGEDRYYPFGETRSTTGTMYTDRLYTGQREMEGLGIYHYGARYYSPALGRFISADTIVPGAANPQAFNRYSYVLNNPIRYTDPSGHICVSAGPGDCLNSAGNPINGSGNASNSGGGGSGGQGGDSIDRLNEDEGGEGNDQRCHTYHPCDVETNLYEIGWENFGQAWEIINNPNATYGQQWWAARYMEVWGGAHLALVAGTIIITRHGIIMIGTQLATQNPNSPVVSLGNNPAYTKDGYTFFKMNPTVYKVLDAIGLAKPMNQQFITNQIAQAKNMEVTITSLQPGAGTLMEMGMLQNSGLYTMYTQTSPYYTGIINYFTYSGGN